MAPVGDDMTRRTRALSLGFLILFAGCDKSPTLTESNAIDTSHPVSGDWAIVRFEGDPDNLNPLLTQQANAAYVTQGVNNSQIYELLMGYDPSDWSLTKPLLADGLPDVKSGLVR